MEKGFVNVRGVDLFKFFLIAAVSTCMLITDRIVNQIHIKRTLIATVKTLNIKILRPSTDYLILWLKAILFDNNNIILLNS